MIWVAVFDLYDPHKLNVPQVLRAYVCSDGYGADVGIEITTFAIIDAHDGRQPEIFTMLEKLLSGVWPMTKHCELPFVLQFGENTQVKIYAL